MLIKPLTKLLVLTLSVALLLLLAACGDEESEPTKLSPLAPKNVTVTIGLTGATLIGSVYIDVLLPEGIILETDSSGQPTQSALTFLVDDAEIEDANYIPAANGAKGEIIAGLAKSSGFVGNADLMQISSIYPANATLPTESSFSVSVIPYDFNTTAIPDISARIRISVQ